MIVGIGIDVSSLARIHAAIERFGDRFVHRILTPDEVTDIEGRSDRAQAVAARFAAKEAAFKALGGPSEVLWHQLQVRRRGFEPPRLVLLGEALRVARQLGVTHAHLSLTHDAGIAAAIVVMEKEP